MRINNDEYHSSDIDVKSISPAAAGGKAPKATLDVRNDAPYINGIKSLGFIQQKTPEVAAGDGIDLVQGYRLTVRKIVPEDHDRHIAGWVELTPSRSGEKEKSATP